jgi:hypothetical protein
MTVCHSHEPIDKPVEVRTRLVLDYSIADIRSYSESLKPSSLEFMVRAIHACLGLLEGLRGPDADSSGKLEKNLTGLTGLFWLIFEISPLRNEISLAQAILRIKIRHLSHISGI